RTTGTRSTTMLLGMAQSGPKVMRPCGFCVAALGAAIRGTAALPSATGTIRPNGAGISVSVLPERCDVRCQAATHELAPLSAHAEGRWHDDRAGQEAELEDDGDQAVMRGLDTAFPFIRPGLSLSLVGRRSLRPTT